MNEILNESGVGRFAIEEGRVGNVGNPSYEKTELEDDES
jgi:hypothetical protein